MSGVDRGCSLNGRNFSVFFDGFDLYRRKSSGKPYYYAKGTCNDDGDAFYHLVFRTEDDLLVSAEKIPSPRPFGHYKQSEVFCLVDEPHNPEPLPLASDFEETVYKNGLLYPPSGLFTVPMREGADKAAALKVCASPVCNCGYACGRPNKADNPRRLEGKLAYCPLEKYEIPNSIFCLFEEASHKDLFFLCATCRYGKMVLQENRPAIDRPYFKDTCVDCPVQAALEELLEKQAEASANT